MSERLTQEELRERIVVSLDSPAGRSPYYCLACQKTEQAGHLAGCPGDKANAVVSREVLANLYEHVFGDNVGPYDWKLIHASLSAALGEEPAP